MNWYIDINEVVTEIGEATRQDQKQLDHHPSWWGWREGGKVFLRTTSGAARHQSEWGFFPPREGRMIFHNSTRNAYCVMRTPPGCPIMKFLYDKGMSYKIIRRHQPGESVLLAGNQQNLHCHYPSARSTVPATCQNLPVTLGEGSNGRPTTYWWGQAWTLETSGPWAVVAEEVADHNGNVSKQVAAIHLWVEPMFMSAEILQSLLKVLQRTLDESHHLPVKMGDFPCWSEWTEIVDGE